MGNHTHNGTGNKCKKWKIIRWRSERRKRETSNHYSDCTKKLQFHTGVTAPLWLAYKTYTQKIHFITFITGSLMKNFQKITLEGKMSLTFNDNKCKVSFWSTFIFQDYRWMVFLKYTNVCLWYWLTLMLHSETETNWLTDRRTWCLMPYALCLQ